MQYATMPAKLDQWWKPKAANLLAVVYAAILVTRLPFAEVLVLLPAAVLTILGIGSFGHLVNDAYDIEADLRAGKANRLAGLPTRKRHGLILGVGVAALVPWLILPFDAFSIALLILEGGLLLAYAVPPVRLKERQVWPIVADAAYAYAVPAILAGHTFFLARGIPFDAALLAPLFVYQLTLGVRHFLNHLALDRSNDVASGTSTLATHRGNQYIHRVIRRVLLPIEATALLGYLLVLSRNRPSLLVAVCGLFLASMPLHAALAAGRRYPLFTYRFSRSHMDRLPQDILPLALLASLTYRDWRFSLVMLAHVVLFYRIGALGWRPLLGLLAWPVAVVDTARRWVGQAARRGHATASAGAIVHLNALAPRPAARQQVNIAIVNINKGKYTETFVDGLIPRLRHNVYYLHGGELPWFDAEDRPFLSNERGLQSIAQTAEVLLRFEKNHFLKSSIASYLQARHIRLVLAEFGPVGIQMLPITRDIGLPLIVYFHGYDVFHKETLRLCGDHYPVLLREAAMVIGVSAQMLARLEALGAPRHKLAHLPAFVNLAQFPYMDHSQLAARFLAVGRFAETKSPHLTILAFQRVAEVLPGARLVMVGKGGGGELFEACRILVKALGLDDRVEFKGVLSHAAVATEMRQARVFVQHSVTTPEQGDREGKPVAVMEAMASGVAVVTTRHSGITELIEDEVTGLLVDEFDVAAMADAMLRLAQDDDLVQRLGRAASTAIHEHPLISRHVQILEGIIDDCIAAS